MSEMTTDVGGIRIARGETHPDELKVGDIVLASITGQPGDTPCYEGVYFARSLLPGKHIILLNREDVQARLDGTLLDEMRCAFSHPFFEGDVDRCFRYWVKGHVELLPDK